MRRRMLATLALLPALALGAQACGGGSGGGGTGAAKSASDDAKLRRFAQCMRENGVDMPDPKDGRIEIRSSAKASGGGPQTDAKLQAAQKKCAHFMPNGGKPRKASPEEIAKLRAYAKCMRDHGVTAFPDPQPDGGMLLKAGGDSVIDPQSQTFKAADKACRKYQPGGGKAAPALPGGDKE